MNRKQNKYLSFKFRLVLFLALVVSLTIIYLCNPSKTYGFYNENDLNITSVSGIVIDGDTGTVLYEKNKDKKIYPASTIKLLTAMIAMDKGRFNDKITVNKEALKGQEDGGVNIALKVDETLTLEDALYATLLYSANDAAIAIGEHIEGSSDKFVKLMNEKAKKIGMKNSHFTNSFGFFNKDQYTTVYDLALLGREAFHNDQLKKIISTSTYTLEPTNKRSYPLKIDSTLLLHEGKIFEHKYFIGGKTGYIEESGNNLVAIFNKDGKNFIIVMSGPLSKAEINKDVINAFDFVIKNYSAHKLSKDGKGNTLNDLAAKESFPFTKLTMNKNLKISAFLPKNYKEKDLSLSVKSSVNLPIQTGDIIGYKTLKYKGKLIAKEPVIAETDFSHFDMFIHRLLVLLKYVLIIGVILVVILLVIRYIFKRRRINKRIYNRHKVQRRYKPYKREKRIFK